MLFFGAPASRQGPVYIIGNHQQAGSCTDDVEIYLPSNIYVILYQRIKQAGTGMGFPGNVLTMVMTMVGEVITF